MTRHISYIGLGSNLADPVAQLRAALEAMASLPDTQLASSSAFYRSQPMGPQDQPDYVNAVACLRTELTPFTLLAHLQQIEAQQGRQRQSQKWGARTLDLDILLYGNQTINRPTLQVPHSGMKTREFVLYPLAEIAPDLILPCGTPLASMLNKCPVRGLKKLDIDIGIPPQAVYAEAKDPG